MSDSELELWGDVLDSTVALADVDHINPSQVVDQIVQCAVKHSPLQYVSFLIGSNKILMFYSPRFLLTPEVTQRLLSHVSAEDDKLLPTVMLAEMSKALLALYPPQTEQLSSVLEHFHHLRTFIKGCTSKTIVGVLEILQNGICAWIEDESEVLLDPDYNDVVSPFSKSNAKFLNNSTIGVGRIC
jgi:hypothetical protein